MHAAEPVQRVRIYLNARDHLEGRPLYLAILALLQREGASGATVLAGTAGFGSGYRVRASGAVGIEETRPLVIEWVDRTERVARMLPLLDPLLPDALITIEEVRVYRAMLTASGPFGDTSVGDAVLADAYAGQPQVLVAAALGRLLDRRQLLLPVLDQAGRVVGLVGPTDWERRAELPLPLALVLELHEAERAALIAGLPARTLADVMVADPRTFFAGAPIPQAISTLIEWGLEALPVVDRDGHYVGLFGVTQALRAALDARRAAGESRAPATPVRLLMQGMVPAISADATALAALDRLRSSSRNTLVVVSDGRPMGVLTAGYLLGALHESLRAHWRTALDPHGTALPQSLVEAMAGRAVSDLPLAPVAQIGERESLYDAIQLLLDTDVESIVVTDSDGRLSGLVNRWVLLRALAQEVAE